MRKYFPWDQGLGQQVLYKCKWFFTTSAEKSIKTKEHTRSIPRRCHRQKSGILMLSWPKRGLPVKWLPEPIIHIIGCQKVIFGCVSPSILFTSCHYSSHFLFKSLVTFCQLVNKNVFAAKSSSSLSLKCNAHRIFFLLWTDIFFR